MDQFVGYSNGVNLGGWLSQYLAYDHEHFESFITQSDIDQIASWGMDHVRLPVDYPVLMEEEAPARYKERGFGYIDRCLEWCARRGLNVILDLHRAPGFSFNFLDESRLFDSPEMQEKFIQLWETITRRYSGWRQTGLVYELLNEVVLPSSKPWNELVRRTWQRMRAIDKHHWIMVGGNYYNSVRALPELELLDDPLVVYTFHFYEPLPFTHQKAYWIEELEKFGQTTEYPGILEGLEDFLDRNPHYEDRLHFYRGISRMDQALLHEYLEPAYEFRQATGATLYCGEFGAIERAPLDSRIRWTRDLVSLLDQAGFGHAVWSYKEMDFGLVDNRGRTVSEGLVEAAGGRINKGV